jgi:hypothetical protein
MKAITSIGLLAFSLCCSVACSSRAVPKTTFKTTIDSYYQAHPACIWMSEKTFPVKASAGDAKAAGYDALVDQGLLTRTAATHRESIYAISSEGQPFWISDPGHPGAGNLCYGHREVVSIDHASPTPDRPGYSTIVSYHYTVAGVPAWASAADIQSAFPEVNANGALQMAIATLTDTNNGWQLSPPANSAANPPTSAANEPTSTGGKAVHKGAASE